MKKLWLGILIGFIVGIIGIITGMAMLYGVICYFHSI